MKVVSRRLAIGFIGHFLVDTDESLPKRLKALAGCWQTDKPA
jgi:hypothetical protein